MRAQASRGLETVLRPNWLTNLPEGYAKKHQRRGTRICAFMVFKGMFQYCDRLLESEQPDKRASPCQCAFRCSLAAA